MMEGKKTADIEPKSLQLRKEFAAKENLLGRGKQECDPDWPAPFFPNYGGHTMYFFRVFVSKKKQSRMRDLSYANSVHITSDHHDRRLIYCLIHIRSITGRPLRSFAL